jgi:hypothetical protein
MALSSTLALALTAALLTSCASLERSFPRSADALLAGHLRYPGQGDLLPAEQCRSDAEARRHPGCAEHPLDHRTGRLRLRERWHRHQRSGFTNNPVRSSRGVGSWSTTNHQDKTPAIKYSVHVLRAGGAECTRYDPFISNQ